jgi:RNA polymerase sigma factor (sigma-70 family)
MQIEKSELTELITLVVETTIKTLVDKKLLVSANPKMENAATTEKTAYQKTETLLYNYNGFKRVIQERYDEIDELKRVGIPKKSTSIVEYTPHTGKVSSIVLPEESVESAVQERLRSVQGTVQVVELIDKCMSALKNDPYYCILEMRYFEGRTQEDIAEHLGCSQVTVSKNKNRLVKELSLRLFPNLIAEEMMH